MVALPWGGFKLLPKVSFPHVWPLQLRWRQAAAAWRGGELLKEELGGGLYACGGP